MPDVAVGGIHRDAGEAVAEPVPAEFGGVDDRVLRRPPAEMRWAGEVAVALLRESPGRGLAGNEGLVESEEGGTEEGGRSFVGIGVEIQ